MKLFSILRQRSLLVFACVMLAVHTPPAFSQAAGARGDYFLYDVVSGDTLIALAQRYTGNPYNWRPLQTLNSVEDPYRLPIGARLRIPFSLIPELASQAKLSHVAGTLPSMENKPVSRARLRKAIGSPQALMVSSPLSSLTTACCPCLPIHCSLSNGCAHSREQA